MPEVMRTVSVAIAVGLVLGVPGITAVHAASTETARAEARPALLDNFGFPFGFDVSKMDLKADPRQDFRRYAAGRWLDEATLPPDRVRISGIDVLMKRVDVQIQSVLDDATRASATAAKGSPTQQVGDFYASGMDEKRLTDLGVAPLRPELDRIAAIDGRQELSEALARLSTVTNDVVLFGPTVSTDTIDRQRYAVYVVDADLPLGLNNYLKPDAQKIRDAYLKRIADYLVLAGSTPDEAKTSAAKILAIETRIAGKKLTPVEKRDPAKRFTRVRYDELKAMLGSVDLDAYFAALGLPTGGEVIVQELAPIRERNALLIELPPADTQAYLRWELLRRTSAYLTPAFIEINKTFTESMYGKIDVPPRNEMVAVEVAGALGHPLGQLYVAKYSSPETRKAAEQLVALVKAEFRGRIEKNTWLSPPTRQEALVKLDAMKVSVGYPAQWIDYTGVDIRRDDYFGNVVRVNDFKMAVLRRQGRRRRQLLLARRRHRARVHARVRFDGAPVRRQGQRARLVDRGRCEAFWRRGAKAGQAGRRGGSAARPAHQRRAVGGREPRRRGRGLARPCRVTAVPACAPAGRPPDRWHERVTALPPGLGADVGRQVQRGLSASDIAGGRAPAGPVPHAGALAA